jgi:hypothetical protein
VTEKWREGEGARSLYEEAVGVGLEAPCARGASDDGRGSQRRVSDGARRFDIAAARDRGPGVD